VLLSVLNDELVADLVGLVPARIGVVYLGHIHLSVAALPF